MAEENEDHMDDNMKVHQLTVISLKEEFTKFLQPSEVMDLIPSLPASEKEKIKLLEEQNRRQSVELLIDTVVRSSGLLNKFIVSLKRKGYKKLYHSIHQNRSAGTSAQSSVDSSENLDMTGEQFEFLVNCLKGELVGLIQPVEIMHYLRSSKCLNDEDCEIISSKERSSGPHAACREMFERLPRRKKNWATLFIDALKQHHKHVIKKLDPNEAYDDDSDTDLKKKVHKNIDDQEMSSMDETITEDVVMVEGAGDGDGLKAASPGDTEEDIKNSNSPYFSDEDEDDEDDDKNKFARGKVSLDLREYQYELAEKALQGKNTIICAGTGSGKTRVSVYIMQKHLESLPRDKTKVVFFARTVPLVEQQYKAIKKFMPEYRVLHMTGGTENNKYLHLLLKKNDIIVLTPQVLVNHLDEGTIPSIDIFSMLVFDECHHTQKGEPYNSIMKRYLKLKYDKVEGRRMPQIVGLTASIGVAKSKTDEEAADNILKICANLDVPYISTVEKHEEEYKKHVAIPEESAKLLQERATDPVKDILHVFMTKVEDMLLISDVMRIKAIRSLLLRIPKDKSSQEYYTWTVELAKFVKLSLEDEQLSRFTLTCNRMLKAFNRALEVNELLRAKDVLNHLMKEITLPEEERQTESDKTLSKLFTDVRTKLVRILRDDRSDNPNLEMIPKYLKDSFKNTGNDSRFIVFVRTRITAMALSEFLDENDLKCSYLTGTGTNEEEGGMTKADQENIIGKLKVGSLMGIVATSVAEEGLDISDCNLILRYNHVGNEITTIQARGRSRKKGGKSVLFAKSKIYEREVLNSLRAAMMFRAIKLIKKLNHRSVVSQLEQIQQEILKEEEIREMICAGPDGGASEEFNLFCSDCKQFAISTCHIRTVGTHHVVVDTNFFNRIFEENLKKCKKFDDINIFAQIKCTKCSQFWGHSMIHKKVHFPILKINSFVFKSLSSDHKHIYTKWRDVPCNILPVDDSHYELMASMSMKKSD